MTHAPSHRRDMFLNAIDAYCRWPAGTTQPTVDFEIHYEPRKITLRKACGILWNCTDQLPSEYLNMLEGGGLQLRSGSYGAAAQAMHAELTQLGGEPAIPRPTREERREAAACAQASVLMFRSLRRDNSDTHPVTIRPKTETE